MLAKIQMKRDSLLNWMKNNPILSEGEPAYCTDTKSFKIGDSANSWRSLEFKTFPKNAVILDTPYQSGQKVGSSVAIQGNYIVVGASLYDAGTGNPDTGCIYLYNISSGTWQRLVPPIVPYQAASESVSIDGDYIVVGAPNYRTSTYTYTGCAYIYSISNGSWQRLTVPGQNYQSAGESVAIDGDYVVVGAPYYDSLSNVDTGCVHLFTISTGSRQRLTPPEQANQGAGYSVAISVNYIVVGAPWYSSATPNTSTGCIYLYDIASGTWQRLTPPEQASQFAGNSVAIDGNYIVVGAPYYTDSSVYTYTGCIYLYDFSNGTWQKLVPPQYAYQSAGYSVAISGNYIVVGAPGYDNNSGCIYLYDISSGNWNRIDKTVYSMWLGQSVAIDNSFMVIGAPLMNGNDGGVYITG